MFGKILHNLRSSQELKPINDIVFDVRAALANPDNIRLWKEGIEKFDASNPSDAFSSFAGFKGNMIARAAEAASGATGDNRFFANDLEALLDPARIAFYVEGLSHNAPQYELDQGAHVFFNATMISVVAERHATMSAPAARSKMGAPIR